MTALTKVCIIGSGNWGSVIAKIVGYNVAVNPDKFELRVPIWVFEEIVDGCKLSEIINTKHENVKYLPGIKIPENVVAVPDVVETALDADIIIFVIPHQFIRNVCKSLKGKVKSTAIAVSLIKGLDVDDGKLQLISSVITDSLDGVQCAVLMGANIAQEVAIENFCEATIGCENEAMGKTLKELFQTPYFRMNVVPDKAAVELCGALKNVVAMGAGFTDGLKFGDNTKAAVIRLGLMEIVEFCRRFFGCNRVETYLESCGFADLIATCYSGRNRRIAQAFVTAGKTIEELEKELLNGQKLQGPPTAAEVNVVLKEQGLEDRFPIFTCVHKICIQEVPVQEFLKCLVNHPEHV